MAYCKKCEKDVEPILKGSRYFCPECNLFVKVGDEEREEATMSEPVQGPQDETPYMRRKKKMQPAVEQIGTQKLVMAPKTIKYDASDLHMGEILINLGFAKDLNDLTRKNMKLAFTLMNMGGIGKGLNAMENTENKSDEPNPQKLRKELIEDSMMRAYVKNLEGGGQSDPMQMMMLMRMMDNKDSGKEKDNGLLDKMLEIQMIKSMSGGNDQTAAISREIADLKSAISTQQIIQQAQQKGAPSMSENLIALEKIRADRETQINIARLEAQKERDASLKVVLDTKLNNMERQISEAQSQGQGLGAGQLNDFRETLKAVKDMQSEIGSREKSTAEAIGDTLGQVANTIGPPLVEVLKAKQTAPMPQPLPPEPTEMPTGQMAGGQMQQLAGQVPQPNPGPSQEPSELSPSEQQMSSTMEDMYLRPKKRIIE